MADVKVVRLGVAAFGLHCHPSEDLFVAGLIDGSIRLYRHDDSSVTLSHSWKLHKKASRAVTFIDGGKAIVSASAASAFRVVDVESQQLTHTVKKIHSSPIYSLYAINNWTLASGDDDGTVKLWDMRQRPVPVMQESACTDRISDLVSDGQRNALLATSGDGTLSVFNYKKRKLVKQSDQNDCDLNCASFVKGGKKVACGTGDGTIHIYSYSEWGDMSDRCRIHPACESVDTSVAVDDGRLCIACDDGTVRLVQIHPNKNLGVLGRHDNGDSVERLSLSHDGRHVLSASLDETVRLWDVASYASAVGSDSDCDDNSDSDGDSDSDSDEDSDDIAAAGKSKSSRIPNDSDSDASSDSGSTAAKRKGQSGKRKQPAAKRKKPAGKDNFFADL